MITRYVETLFCDDIRHEMGGKLSFIGVYSGELLVPAFPVTLPKLCLFVNIVTPAEEPFRSLNLRILKDTEIVQEIASDEAQLTALSDSAKDLTIEQRKMGILANQVTATFSPMRFDGPCTLSVRVRTEDGELHGKGLKVDQAQPPVDAVPKQT
ncbi:DUF6941 family protein [Candidatus Thiosymbion oneisti]|uniref:DUF6941 family protein n=1 Tax=Candidatus Thiosymbion oneisti TaxID=589554 RepID=UPI00105F8C56|nr:hypothetical protein [Candidatus Thiosymbion oneisti]